MTKRIHVVGLSPRTGTTLMAELIAASYRIDGHADHEMSIFEQPAGAYRIFCSKRPADLVVTPWILRFDPNLWVINMVRDPRDVVVSRHRRDPSSYWVHLGVWKERQRIAARLRHHPRFLEVRYEDLVRTPGTVQAEIERHIPFLDRTGDFRDFHDRSVAHSRSQDALGGIRPIDAASIGKWRAHKPRLLAQIERHGSIDDALRSHGYEEDAAWISELDGVIADNGRTHFPEHRPLHQRWNRSLRLAMSSARYVVRLSWSKSRRTA